MAGRRRRNRTPAGLILFFVIFCLCQFVYHYGNSIKPETLPSTDKDYAYDHVAYSYGEIPEYMGENVTVMNGNMPYADFSEYGYAQEEYSPFDSLGRCGPATAILCPETLPSEERGAIGHVKPSGWHTVKYNEIVDGNYLYNRCHLIAYSLAGENDNVLNLVTGTRYLNVTGMLPYEMQVLDYIRTTGNPVGYRVTPMFADDELVCRGVLMEALSLDDDGICFCVFVHNVQPGIMIDYLTGESHVTDG